MEALIQFDQDYSKYYTCIMEALNSLSYFQITISLLLIFAVIYITRRQSHVYLVDFSCFQAPAFHRISVGAFIEHSALREEQFNTTEVNEFEKKVIVRSGMGNETYCAEGSDFIPSDNSLKQAMIEVKLVLFTVVETLLKKHKINPKSIDILVTNCSINCPTPSLSSLVINKFGFRSNIRSFHLSGMGCSAGILAISLAKDLLKVHKNSLALVLSTETISSNVYLGKQKSMLLANCLFRIGGAGILLSNRKCDRKVAKYELQHIVRTHLGAKDDAYTCVFQKADEDGKVGVRLSRTVVHVAGEVLKTNLTTLGPLVLPYSEQIQFALHFVWTKFWPRTKKQAPYVPNFKKAFDHFCIHAGGKAVVDAIKERLSLSEWDVEASKMTLYRYGNTSSSSTWYSLCYLEAKGRVKKGDKVFQICFGSGFKCNSAVWKRISKVVSKEVCNAWSDRINRYPIDVPEIIEH
ncbi:3-ketoacyl-CoA synthase 7-like [Beta vulgaris subsp. vulgaris]|uniref:3-ketoacyl-CoA synthase 7-like n=1 Tax=Beta vulgaris subsp. vulgaris TaxID=3555 RepID=UPI0025469161|nr:3-ketoacyl-CoA synthase 7-like [Beta vulgaris subsp. vulgaris]